jgi:uncharacterized protein (TIGR00725 family)
MRKPVVGVMGASANDGLNADAAIRLKELADELGSAIAKNGCVLVTGATTGIPDRVAQAFRRSGGFALGISPAENQREHCLEYGLPDDGADVIIYTGFGYKGRNVINIRSSDIVIIFGGAIGTLNEFTIAYDEAKIIGVLTGSGGIADHIQEIIAFCKKDTHGVVLTSDDPQSLILQCMAAFKARAN